jgi:riboflavin synthase
MFTGIITEIGTVKGLSPGKGSARLEISCIKTPADIREGDSVAVNGVCLSALNRKNPLAFDVVGNTLGNTNLKRLRRGDKVNLEKALKLGDNISGHLVSGHIDGERKVKKNISTRLGRELDIEMLPGDDKYLVSKGSVAVDGVSLTVARSNKGSFSIYLIPHTLENSTLVSRKAGEYVNVEYDMMGKYAAKRARGPITLDMLDEKGFI